MIDADLLCAKLIAIYYPMIDDGDPMYECLKAIITVIDSDLQAKYPSIYFDGATVATSLNHLLFCELRDKLCLLRLWDSYPPYYQIFADFMGVKKSINSIGTTTEVNKKEVDWKTVWSTRVKVLLQNEFAVETKESSTVVFGWSIPIGDLT